MILEFAYFVPFFVVFLLTHTNIFVLHTKQVDLPIVFLYFYKTYVLDVLIQKFIISAVRGGQWPLVSPEKGFVGLALLYN